MVRVADSWLPVRSSSGSDQAIAQMRAIVYLEDMGEAK